MEQISANVLLLCLNTITSHTPTSIILLYVLPPDNAVSIAQATCTPWQRFYQTIAQLWVYSVSISPQQAKNEHRKFNKRIHASYAYACTMQYKYWVAITHLSTRFDQITTKFVKLDRSILVHIANFDEFGNLRVGRVLSELL
jgi:hypothetical protein